MKSYVIESEHFTLLGGLLSLLVSAMVDYVFFLSAGIALCILSYAIDLVKRVKETD